MKIALLALLFLFMVFCPARFDKGWRGIVPLHSNRADVEKLLGRSHGDCRCLYDNKGGGVFVQYATLPCKGSLPGGQSNPHGWNVPSDTVLRFTVYSKAKRKFSDLRLDLSKYAKSQDNSSATYYSNRELGIEYEVSWDGFIQAISYIPSTADQRLRCSGFAPDHTSVNRPRPFEQYGNLDFEKEKIRLDGVAIALQDDPNMRGYIIVYGAPFSKLTDVSTRMEQARNYLIRNRGINPDVITAVNGGYREEFTVELFVLPKNSTAPVPTPIFIAPHRRPNY